MRFRVALVGLLLLGAGAYGLGAGEHAGAQTPSATATAVAQAPCPTGGTLSVAAPSASAPSTVSVTIAPPLGNLKAASAGDPQSLHLHYFIDTPAAAAGAAIPTGNAAIIHSGTLTQDLGALGAGSHTVIVVVGQLNHTACALRGQVSFTTAAQVGAAVSPPKTGSGGLLAQTTEAASSPLGVAALASFTLIAVGGAGLAIRRR
ncbi:MAG: hypothetical protein U0360_08185 [Dehalococcoidia bacterium]